MLSDSKSVSSPTTNNLGVNTHALSESNIRTPWATIALAAVCLLWAGMVLDNSFSAGIRFTAPSIHAPGGRAFGMDVGRTVFSAFNKVEIGWSLISFCLLIIARPFHRTPKGVRVLLPLLWLVVLLQTTFLLPALVQRALMVMDGQTPPPSSVHALYSSSELLKLIALIACGILLLRALVNSSTNSLPRTS